MNPRVGMYKYVSNSIAQIWAKYWITLHITQNLSDFHNRHHSFPTLIMKVWQKFASFWFYHSKAPVVGWFYVQNKLQTGKIFCNYVTYKNEGTVLSSIQAFTNLQHLSPGLRVKFLRKVVSYGPHKGTGGSGGIVSLILNFGTRWWELHS